MDSDGSNISNLTTDTQEDYSPSWSPDGKWIAYTNGDSAQYDVWLIHVGPRNKIRLINVPKRNQTPVWKPD